MAHQNTCQNCAQTFTGRIDKRFCSDACSKYFRRHGRVSLATPTPHPSPDKAGLVRTSARAGGSGLANYAAKKGIDLIAKYVETSFTPPKKEAKLALTPPPAEPLLVMTADDILDDTLADLLRNDVPLETAWQEFLGPISYPLKMLVWGLPGSGKSTFCMQLANQMAATDRLVYIAGEEDLTSHTLTDKQRRSIINPQAKKNAMFIDRLPTSAAEWHQVTTSRHPAQSAGCQAIFYDSVTQLGISPFYARAAAAEFNVPILATMAHIFITHAHKNGQEYRGDGSWGHEVDVMVRVEKGIATTTKNRFGPIGRSLRVF